jgi:hypothetical protein
MAASNTEQRPANRRYKPWIQNLIVAALRDNEQTKLAALAAATNDDEIADLSNDIGYLRAVIAGFVAPVAPIPAPPAGDVVQMSPPKPTDHLDRWQVTAKALNGRVRQDIVTARTAGDAIETARALRGWGAVAVDAHRLAEGEAASPPSPTFGQQRTSLSVGRPDPAATKRRSAR